MPQVRLIDQDKNQVGIIGTSEALQRAQAAGLDLVEVSPNSSPPVCRIMDYGKFLYEQQKKQKEARRHQHQVKVKEIKLSPRISDHDYEYRMEQAKKFVQAGDRLKLTVVFRGREMTHKEFGMRLIERFREDMSEHAVVDKEPSFAGRNLVTIFIPKK